MKQLIAGSGHEANGALIGMLLGDSSMNKAANAVLLTGHALRHRDYLDFKFKFLEPYLGGTIRERLHKGDGDKWKDRMAVHWWTKALKRLNHHYNDFYPNGKKIVKKSVLNRLTPLGLAFWFMDDGYVYTDITPNETKVFKGIALCTNCYDAKSIQTIRDWFKTQLNMDFTVDSRNVIHSTAESGWRFLAIVKPFVELIESMRYKVDLSNRVDFDKSRSYAKLPQWALDRLNGTDSSTPYRGFVWQLFPKRIAAQADDIVRHS